MAELKKAIAEVEFLARHARPFQLHDLKIKPDFPNAGMLSLTAADKSGTLEYLHCECVHRIYRRSLASSYTLNETLVDRVAKSERQQLMLRQYRAPFILKEFTPHFTLLPASSDDDRPANFAAVQREFQTVPRKIGVDAVAIMARNDDGTWAIRKEVPLGGD